MTRERRSTAWRGAFVSRTPVQVEWIDTYVSPGWHEVEVARAADAKLMYTVGYLLEVTGTDVKLFMTQNDEDREIGTLKVIPRSTVRAMRMLRAGSRRPIRRMTG